ncbi:MAG: prepilin peptidase, partial [Bilophila wadsworthia]
MTVFGATILGLILGSFYNVCIHRYVSGESILFPP